MISLQMPKIAVIPPVNKPDYLANTVLDGLMDLNADFRVTDNYPAPFSLEKHVLKESDFIAYAQSADLVILCWGKGSTNFALAEKIGKWDKTVFVDGSELGKDRRWDPVIAEQVLNMTYEGIGAIDKEMLAKCKKYFRREKPYVKGILPFPFGIERRYRSYKSGQQKDIDIVCIFGQEDFPKMRKEIRMLVEDFGKKNKLKTATKKTSGFTFDDNSKKAGRDEFYELLARAKAGVSVGGGGYDTARFWEILGNNCTLLTEKIDIQIPGGLDYKRVIEFKDVSDFKQKLESLKQNIPVPNEEEYNAIITVHSTKSRMEYLLKESL
jgi:hypothetical protein